MPTLFITYIERKKHANKSTHHSVVTEDDYKKYITSGLDSSGIQRAFPDISKNLQLRLVDQIYWQNKSRLAVSFRDDRWLLYLQEAYKRLGDGRTEALNRRQLLHVCTTTTTTASEGIATVQHGNRNRPIGNRQTIPDCYISGNVESTFLRLL